MNQAPQPPGLAFPFDGHVHEPAMTLRDRFAMAALTGMLSNPSATAAWLDDIRPYCEAAYDAADCMMKARKK